MALTKENLEKSWSFGENLQEACVRLSTTVKWVSCVKSYVLELLQGFRLQTRDSKCKGVYNATLKRYFYRYVLNLRKPQVRPEWPSVSVTRYSSIDIQSNLLKRLPLMTDHLFCKAIFWRTVFVKFHIKSNLRWCYAKGAACQDRLHCSSELSAHHITVFTYVCGDFQRSSSCCRTSSRTCGRSSGRPCSTRAPGRASSPHSSRSASTTPTTGSRWV